MQISVQREQLWELKTWSIKADCLFLSVCQHCKENEERPSCDRGVWWRCPAQKISQWNRGPQATASWGKCQNNFFFFLQSCCVRPNTACWMTAARSPLWRVDDLPTGFFSHTDHSDGKGGSLPAAPRKGSAPERAGGQDQKLNQTSCHQLKPGSCSQGKYDSKWSSG